MLFKEVIVVEGRDDTRRLKEIFPDIETIETNGSAIDKPTLERIKILNETRGVIVFTDPDFPGNKIRQAVTEVVPECKHAYLKKQDAIAKNGSGVGVEHASNEAIKAALENLLTASKTIVEEIEMQFLIENQLIGHANSSSLREHLSDVLGIGYVNGKQLQKRLMMFGISKEQVIEALSKK
ncbi:MULTISPECIES: ribonuclease M5 [Turicibacter]|jgi:ribonuclease M5|uniref:Ribonuclease M5 n=2 Tax=Turicibacter sanguinis TaxID=154288 RepID=A0A173S2Z3_9FIRM|nr:MULTISPECIES: ribonuclease M5 [Turicibacter]EFF63493.1 ribonuclease M5 [Turicibacter sanguinis PC909]EGC93060.1 ribonuclease M5 [Turicibacter sp. HGF1]MBP3903212.1 ribonuclease M5 [Turicibacter sp.]MCU7191081.1 ribonuclease M5 [Turicibacter sanguinis]MCU7197909.1 ribonuclease M5 [Turicibacter sanguinis]